MPLVPVLALGPASCGHYGFAMAPDARATGSDAAVALRCAWDPVPAFVMVEPLTIVNTSGWEGEPTLSRDQLTLFYRNDLGFHMSRRASPTSAFGPPEDIATTVPFGSDVGLFLAANNLDAFTCVLAGTNNYDISTIARATETSPFGTPVTVTELATAFNEFNPRLSPDEQTLLFLRWSGPDASTARLQLAHRRGSVWAGIEQVFPTSTELEEAGSFVGDSLHIVYSSDGDLYVASRATETDAFGSPTLITGPGIGISTTDNEENPFVSADGCELLFLSSRVAGQGVNDIYHAVAVP